MKKLILFSTPLPSIIDKILPLIFPEEMNNKVLAYMPSDGANCKQQYVEQWKGFAKDRDTEFRYIDNSINSETEKEKLRGANILVITGGNTFKLLDNLRKSGLDKEILEFTKKSEFVLAGFSAGAIVLTPTIEICNAPGYDVNEVGLKDLTGLNIVDFEVFPHYSMRDNKFLLDEYRSSAKNIVKEIADDGWMEIDLK